MTKMLSKAFFYVLAVACAGFLALSFEAHAQDLAFKDLGVESTGILPSNPFYFFKSWSRTIRQTFTFSDVSRAGLQLDILNEQAAEIKKLLEINPDSLEGFERAVGNYITSAVTLKTRLLALRGNPNIGKLIDLLLDRALKHKEVLDDLLGRFNNQDGAESFRKSVAEAEDRLADAVASVPGNLEDAKKFSDNFQGAVVKQKGELREFIASEFLDQIEGKVRKDSRDELLKLKDALLLKWAGRLRGMLSAPGSSEANALRALEVLSGDSELRLKILDEAREKIADIGVKNTIGAVRQRLLDAARESDSISKESVQAIIADVINLIKEATDRLGDNASAKPAIASLIERARFNLDSAQKFFDEGSYGSAYGAAIAASAAVKNAIAGLVVKSIDYAEDLRGLKIYFDALSDKAKTADLNEDNQPKLFALFKNAEDQIVRLADLANQGSDSPKIATALRELKATLGAIEQLIEEAIKVDALDASAAPNSQNEARVLNTQIEVPSMNVIISNNQFVPAVLKIKAGTRITWTNKDSEPHWVASAANPTTPSLPGLDSLRPLARGESYSFVFDKIGTWKYQDHLNLLIIGIVDVE